MTSPSNIQPLRRCYHCGEYKSLDHFGKDSYTPDKLRRACNECNRAKAREYTAKNRDFINKKRRERRKNDPLYRQKNIERARKYKQKHRAELAAKQRRYQKEHREERAEYSQTYYAEHKKKIWERRREKLRTDSIAALKSRVRIRIRTAMQKRGVTMPAHAKDIVGCEWDELWRHLLVTWETNYGAPWSGEPYHIDHITPLDWAETGEDVIALCHYGNLQMLKPKDNIRKKNNFELKWLI